MLPICEFARAGNVTVRTLRFYDELGLLSPAHVVPENGYRRYSPAQFAQLNQIQAFKDMGFSLQEIRELLERRLAAQELKAVLEARCEVLRKRLRDDAGRLERIAARLTSISAGSPQSHPTIMLRSTPGQLVVSLREKLQSYDQADELFKTLERSVDPRVLSLNVRQVTAHDVNSCRFKCRRAGPKFRKMEAQPENTPEVRS